MLIFNYDYEAELKAERAEARAEGFAEGFAEGEAKIIKLMNKKGISIEKIAKIVKKSVKDVEAILSMTTE